MPGFLKSLTTLYRAQMERHHNRPFLDAAMAACALIAIADGKVTFAQRVRVDQILETLDKLKMFDPHEGVDLFNAYIEGILTSPKDGRLKALGVIRAAAADPETARLLIRLCLAVSEVNIETRLADQIEIVMLCGFIGVEPRDLGLYVDKSPDEIATGKV